MIIQENTIIGKSFTWDINAISVDIKNRLRGFLKGLKNSCFGKEGSDDYSIRIDISFHRQNVTSEFRKNPLRSIRAALARHFHMECVGLF